LKNIAQQNAGVGPGLLRGLSEVPGSGKFIFLSELLVFKKPGPSVQTFSFISRQHQSKRYSGVKKPMDGRAAS
jgi:hypothetical protein